MAGWTLHRGSRWSSATWLPLRWLIGASPKEVAARAGHTSVSYALDRYGHLFPESDAAHRDRLDALFRQPTEQGRNMVA